MEKRISGGVFYLLWLYDCIFVVSATENTDCVLELSDSLICPHVPFVPICLQSEQLLFTA